MTDKNQKEQEKEWFCRHCKKKFGSLILYCPSCHSEDALIRDEFSFKEGKREALKLVINKCLEWKK